MDNTWNFQYSTRPVRSEVYREPRADVTACLLPALLLALGLASQSYQLLMLEFGISSLRQGNQPTKALCLVPVVISHLLLNTGPFTERGEE